mmetsp:Transcript_8610/g.13334  ORF Transcript_8610/g.13334 Transcript_8610/m.13334 type:complete len:191 (+) Transcript_8610:17-589(+)
MGNDGGSMAYRSELVKLKKKKEVVDKGEAAKMKSTLCTLSKEPLKQPVCVCRLGNLYNWDEVVKRLVEKTLPLPHIKKMKDVKKISFSEAARKEKADQSNPMNDFVSKKAKVVEEKQTTIMCPVTLVEFNGINGFVVNWHCGCLISKRAQKELKTQNSECLACSVPFPVVAKAAAAEEEEEWVSVFKKKL